MSDAEADPSSDWQELHKCATALPAPRREVLNRLWWNRSANELASASQFATLRTLGEPLKLPDALLKSTQAAVVEEQTHSSLCAQVAACFGNEPNDLKPARHSIYLPDHSERLMCLLHFVTHCCLSETVAVDYLQRCRAQTDSKPLRRVLHVLMKDEVKHAQLGWAVLKNTALTPAERAQVKALLPELLRGLRAAWLDDTAEHSAHLTPGYGFISRRELEPCLTQTIAGVIQPGFQWLLG